MFNSCLAITATIFVVIDGLPNDKLRIAGGTVQSIFDYPYVVSIWRGGRHICGGSVISKNIILTAAHCVPPDFNHLKIRAGSSYSRTGGTVFQLESAIVHEDFKEIPFSIGGSTVINDIALIKVKSPFFVSGDTIAPISMLDAGQRIAQGSLGIVNGWGRVPLRDKKNSTSEDRLNNQLRSVVVSIIDKRDCAREHAKLNYTLKPGEMCAGVDSGGSCDGDSGGPLVVDKKLVGIVSWSFGDCGQADVPPGIFTEVAYFRQWIDENVRKLENDYDTDDSEDRPIWDADLPF